MNDLRGFGDFEADDVLVDIWLPSLWPRLALALFVVCREADTQHKYIKITLLNYCEYRKTIPVIKLSGAFGVSTSAMSSSEGF